MFSVVRPTLSPRFGVVMVTDTFFGHYCWIFQIEHIIQASDVSHTMQHWHIYKKWNERLFQEMYQAYCEGRMEKDPSQGWYKGGKYQTLAF